VTQKSVVVWHDRRMPKEPKWVAFCCVVILVALYVVGVMRHGVLRNMVQTLPLWIPIVLGFRGNEFAKWSALPCLVIWLAGMMIVWLFLFRWTKLQWWHFSPTEIAMTLIMGVAAATGLGIALHWRTAVRPFSAGAVALLFGALQLLTLLVSLPPAITHK
jgi:predicted neutral ceramidase superfamily lipid hydrolase